MTEDPSKFDFFFVLLADGYSPYEFEENAPFFSKGRSYSSIQLIGGTDRAILVTCKESLLHSRSLRTVVDSYSPVPLMARIHPAIIKYLAAKWDKSPLLNLTFSLLPESEIPQTLTVQSIDDSLNAVPAVANEKEIVSFLHTSLSSPASFHIFSSSLKRDDSFIQGTPRVTLNNVIALLKASIIETIEVKSSFKLMSLRDEPSGSMSSPSASPSRTPERPHASVHD